MASRRPRGASADVAHARLAAACQEAARWPPDSGRARWRGSRLSTWRPRSPPSARGRGPPRRPAGRAGPRRRVRPGLPRLRAGPRGRTRRAHRRSRREPGDAGSRPSANRPRGSRRSRGGPAGRRGPARLPGRLVRLRHGRPGLPLRRRRGGRAGGGGPRPPSRRPPRGRRHRLGLVRLAHGRPRSAPPRDGRSASRTSPSRTCRRACRGSSPARASGWATSRRFPSSSSTGARHPSAAG